MSVYEEFLHSIKLADVKRMRQIAHHKGIRNTLNFLQRDLNTPLEVAIEACGKSGVGLGLKVLVEQGFDINEEVNHEPSYRCGWRPIWSVIRGGNPDVLLFFIRHGAQLNWRIANIDCNPPPLSAVCWMAHRLSNRDDLINLLVDAGAELNPTGAPPPLHCLLAAGRSEKEGSLTGTARLLLQKGASPNFPGILWTYNGNMGISGGALHAYWNSGFEMVETLMQSGADPSIVASNGETAVQFFGRYRQLVGGSGGSGGSNPEVAEVGRIIELLGGGKLAAASLEPALGKLLSRFAHLFKSL